MNRRLYPRTLRGRLALVALLTSGLWVAALTVAFDLALDGKLHEQADSVLSTRAEAVTATVATGSDGTLTVHEPALDRALDTGVWIYQGDRVIDRPSHVSASLQRRADELARTGSGFADTSTQHATRFYALPVFASHGHRRVGAVVTSVSLDAYRLTARSAFTGSLALAVLLLGGVGLLTRMVVGRALRPMGAMTAQAARWSEAGTAKRFGTGDRPAELASLAANLDALLDRLSAVVRHEQQQAADISHELRTPLARISAETEWLGKRHRTAAEVRASHASIANAADSMQRICESLLSEARARTGQIPGSCRFPRLAEELSRRSTAEQPTAPRILVRGDAATAGVSAAVAERILSPLLENARRYSVRTIAIECRAPGRTVRVSIVDDGPGVPDAFTSSLFEPGHRAAPQDGHDGAGLGLALARRLARAAGGDLVYEGNGHGARFTVILPAG